MGATSNDIADLGATIDRIATEVGLSGVVRVDVGGVSVSRAYGLAHRGLGIPNTIDGQFATASGSKTFTALAVMSMVERHELGLDTTARSVLGEDLRLIDDRVTIEHLLAHRSGIGDYLDEETVTDWTDYLMPVPVQELATTEQFVRVLDGHPMKFEPGERFVYCNGGYVVLALIAERVAGVPFHDLVAQRVTVPAGMTDTAYLRSDELPARAALGYLEDEGLRTNVFHLPVRGNGDGGAYTTAADLHTFWDALFAGRIVSPDTVAEMTRPRSDAGEHSMQYGLGFWLYGSTGAVSLHGFDTGVGLVSARDPADRFAYSVLGNKGHGAWPCSQALDELIATLV